MTYLFLEHTSEVRMEVEDGTIPGLFAQSLAGMFSYLQPVKRKQEVKRAIVLHSSDITTLLVDFLNEALSLAQSNKEAYDAVRFDKLVAHELKASLTGHKVSAFRQEIKAATYHKAKIERVTKGAGWRAHIIFDI